METKKFSIVYRIMHWAIAFCLLFMLFTIFLRLTWLNKVNVAEILGNELSQKDVNLTSEELIKIAKKIRKPMWAWHVYIGYVLIGLYAIRMILPLFGEMKFKFPRNEKTLKNRFKQWIYLFFYVGLTATLATGFLIVNGPKTWKDSMEGIHELSLYYILTFIVIHFAGILMAEFGSEKGIVSKMIGK